MNIDKNYVYCIPISIHCHTGADNFVFSILLNVKYIDYLLNVDVLEGDDAIILNKINLNEFYKDKL